MIHPQALVSTRRQVTAPSRGYSVKESRHPIAVIRCSIPLRVSQTFGPIAAHDRHPRSWTCPMKCTQSPRQPRRPGRPTGHSTGHIPGRVPRSSSPHFLPISRTPPSQGGDRGSESRTRYCPASSILPELASISYAGSPPCPHHGPDRVVELHQSGSLGCRTPR